MLKTILVFIALFLVILMIVRVLQRGVFFHHEAGSRRGGSTRDSFSAGSSIEEADYEVLESHLNNKDRREV